MKFVLPFMVAFFLIPFAQKFLQTATRLSIWHQRLKFARIAAFVLIGVEVIIDKDFISPPVFFGLLLVVAIPAYLLREEVSGARLLLWMIIPFGLVFLIDNLAEFWVPKFYKKHDDYFDSAKAIALITGFVTAIMARNQQKNIDKALKEERIKLELEEEANRILEAKKMDLEYQVAARTAELLQQKQELEEALAHLKATQEQLIQSEKLASLGELTAGIAHEIQNPLNFVNNFSELSVELIEELGPPTPDGGAPEAPFGGWGAFLTDIVQNLEKINYHGKRASSIVKGMLEHSRTSTGVKELTDINKLADEYLRLSYHGLRAKNNNFSADYELIADESLPKIKVIPQDFGRVLLNIISNAFQAIGAKVNGERLKEYRPKVLVSTQIFDNQIVIRVVDNGSGMSDEVKAKIFQPFFTTKPTGEGTGLGLSLAYDIVTKGHGGTIECESKDGDGTTFIISIPILK